MFSKPENATLEAISPNVARFVRRLAFEGFATIDDVSLYSRPSSFSYRFGPHFWTVKCIGYEFISNEGPTSSDNPTHSPSVSSTSRDFFQSDDNMMLREICDRFRSLVDVADRKYRLKTYPDCFVGKDAVSALAHEFDISRERAIVAGQQLVDAGFIRHVANQHDFEDDYLFYRFVKDDGIERIGCRIGKPKGYIAYRLAVTRGSQRRIVRYRFSEILRFIDGLAMVPTLGEKIKNLEMPSKQSWKVFGRFNEAFLTKRVGELNEFFEKLLGLHVSISCLHLTRWFFDLNTFDNPLWYHCFQQGGHPRDFTFQIGPRKVDLDKHLQRKNSVGRMVDESTSILAF